MFLSILLHSFPAQPHLLWEKYQFHLCDDLPRTLTRKGINHLSLELCADYGLHLLESELAVDGMRTLQDVSLPASHNDWNVLLGNQFLLEERSYDPVSELQSLLSCLPMLNTEQRHAFNTILNSVLQHLPQMFFVEGAAGAGKTFLYTCLCHALRSRELIVLCVASTGIAAQLLPGGRTAHSCFKNPS